MSAGYRRAEIVSGLFILICAGVFTAFAFRVQGLDLFGFTRGRTVACRTQFADAKTLEVGAKVTVAGRRVGVVRSIRLATTTLDDAQATRLRDLDPAAFATLASGMQRSAIEVDFELDDASLRLDPRTVVVRLAQDGLLGRHYLALDPGYWAAASEPPLLFESQAALPLVLPGRDAAGAEDLIGGALPLVRRLDGLLGRLESGLLGDTNLSNVEAMLGSLSATTHDLRRMFAADEPTGIQQTLVEPLRGLVSNANGLLARQEPHVEQVLRKLDATAAELEPRLARLESDVHGLVTSLGGQLDALLTAANGVVADNRAELAETVRRLRRTMWEAEMALRKIRSDPSLLLFGDDEANLDARPVDESGFDLSGRVRPFRQRDEAETGGK